MADQLFSNMHRTALERLRGRSPEDIVRHANIIFESNAFHFGSLGQKITVDYPDYTVHPPLDSWHILTVLHYLASADGTPLSEKRISFAQYKDGMIRGEGFDRDAESIIRDSLGLLSEEELTERIQHLGGECIASNADLCARFTYLPNYPVYLKIWLADDEFPASGRMLLDASAEHYLSIEDAVTVGELILNRLRDDQL